jgi:hypothetical protein
VVQLLKALVIPSQKVLASDARVDDRGQDNPVLIIDRSADRPSHLPYKLALNSFGLASDACRNIEEAKQEVQEALEMLRAHYNAGLLSEMPRRITAQLETEHAYCSRLVKQLAICQDYATEHQWDRLAVHCDELLRNPEDRKCTTHQQILKLLLFVSRFAWTD